MFCPRCRYSSAGGVLFLGGLGGGRLHEPLIALGAGILQRLGDARKELSVFCPVVVLDAGSILPSVGKVLDFKKSYCS